MRRSAAVLCGLAVVLASSALAGTLPNYDAAAEAVPAPARFRPVGGVQGAPIARREDPSAAPTFFWARGDQGAASASLRGGYAGMAPEDAARAQLEAHAPRFGLTDFGSAGLQVSSVSSGGRGKRVVRMTQTSGGLEVFRRGLTLLLNEQNQLVAISGAPSADASAADSSAKLPFHLSAPQAISAAFGDLTGLQLDPTLLSATAIKQPTGAYRHFQLASYARPQEQEFRIPARAKQILFPLPGSLVPAYYVELNTGAADSKDSDYYAYVISAADGRLLMRHNLTVDAEFSYRAFADTVPPYTPHDGPAGGAATPHPTGVPNGYRPPFVAPSLVTLQNMPFSQNDPWLPDGATVTTGNNVDAYADLVAPDNFQAGDLRPTVTAPGVFDRTMLFDISPNANAEQIAAATTNLFFVNNWLHDWFYDAGFDESSGNAQANNYGRGGMENDAIRAQAQDYSGTNNANMSTPADGASPRMQMYVFNGPRNARVSVLAPAGVAGDYQSGIAAGFGPQQFDVTGSVVIALDDSNPAGPSTTDACTALTNPAEVVGKIAFVDRGTCPFTLKVQNAQDAGAIGVIVADNAQGFVTDLGGAATGITIPSLRLTLDQGNLLRNAAGLTARLFRGPVLPVDGTVDNQIVAHEWGHYLSNRLIQDSSGLTNNQGRAMGEGWGDFVALLMTVRAEDINVPSNANWTGAFAMAEYATRGISPDSSFFGIRRGTYSVDSTKNALRFRHIMDGVPLPTTTPFAPGGLNSQVHNSGEVWASMLWSCYVSLLRAHPFQEAQDRMKSYLVNGLKLTPASPTYTEARDALLAAALANDPADAQRFWAAFATRGMGVGAVAPDRYSTNHAGVVESYQLGAALKLVEVRYQDSAATPGDADGILDNGETGELVITVQNVGSDNAWASSATVMLNTAGVSIGSRGWATFPGIAPMQTASVSIPLTLSGATTAQRLDFAIVVRDDNQVGPGELPTQHAFRVHYDEVPNATPTESVESAPANLPWATDHDPALSAGAFGVVEFEDLNRTFYGPDLGAGSDLRLVSPPLTVSATEPLAVTFRHAFSFEGSPSEAYDGAVIELSDDGGATWVDVGQSLYTGVLIQYEGNPNPLAGRPALVGESANFPELSPARLELGTAYAGRTVQLRFRIGSDLAVGATGWLLDDVAFTGVTNTPFTAICADSGICNNTAPSVYAGADLTVDEGTPVTLDGIAWDADGQPLTATWARISGPAVTLSPAALSVSFTAPAVSADALLTLRLTVSDGTTSVVDTVAVTIRQVNAAPAVNAGLDLVADEFSTVFLIGTAADSDGDALSYLWTQVAGPPVGLIGANTETVQFTAPDVGLADTLTFRLTVSDGKASVADTVSVQVDHVNRAPLLTAASQTVDERSLVTLSASASDPDGDVLTYAWTQVAGAPVVLAGADTAQPTFTSSEVTADEVLSFQVSVSDGLASSSAGVSVTVGQVNRAPAVNAGVDLVADERAVVTLSGNAVDADGDAVTYSWVQLSGTPVALQGAATATPTFVAPETVTGETLSFLLTVSDGAAMASDSTEVLISPVNRAPSVAALEVIADERSTATLVAVGSDPDGDPVTYSWEQLEGAAVTLSALDTAAVSFSTGEVDSDTVRLFRVTVSDGAASASRNVAVTVRHLNRAPVANPGAAFSAQGKTAVQLDASGSADPEGTALGYAWTQSGGPWVSLTGADTATASFTAPDVRQDTRLTFSLTVSDGELGSAPSTVEVTVTPADNLAPVAVAVLHVAGAGKSITLDGSASSDPDGDALTYAWRQVSGPTVEISRSTSSVATVDVPKDLEQSGETFGFELTVTDARGAAHAVNADTTVTPVGGCASTGFGSPMGLLAVGLVVLLRRRRSTR